MVHPADRFTSESLVALEPEELGLQLLPWLLRLQQSDRYVEHGILINRTTEGSHFSAQRAQVRNALSEAWCWLEGQGMLIPAPQFASGDAKILSRRAIKFAQSPDPKRAARMRVIPKETLHVRLQEDAWDLYHRGKFDTAVFAAMKAVEIEVREAAGLAAADIGADLMRKAFHAESGPLTDKSVERAEREARAHLFAGAIGSYKNPHSHRDVALDDADEAAEIILLANHLLRIVKARRTLNTP